MKLSVGDAAPSFSAIADTEQLISLEQFVGTGVGKKIVLYFYPKDNTPGCTTEACDFSDRFERLQKQNVVVLGVSKDHIKSHQAFKAKFKLPFLLLSDPDAKICEAYGAWRTKMNFGRSFLGIIRSTFVIDENGVIRGVWYNVKVKGHVDEVLKCLSDIS